MPQNDGVSAVEVEARAFSYAAGPIGPTAKRAVPVEAPIEFVLSGSPFAVMMATPADLEDFAFGFLFTERVIERREEIRAVEVEAGDGGFRLRVALAGERLKAHLARKRAIAGRTGCGVCGVEDLAHLATLMRPVATSAPVRPAAIGAALAELESRQPLNALTRAVHAAAWCALDGRIVLVREDVGRHNALDKAIGALWRAGVEPDHGFFVITSRCSFEMVAKAAIFGAGTLVAVSAPTSLALDAARACGVSLLAVARGDGALRFGEGGAAGGIAA
jgi:FdhD protein